MLGPVLGFSAEERAGIERSVRVRRLRLVSPSRFPWECPRIVEIINTDYNHYVAECAQQTAYAFLVVMSSIDLFRRFP